MKYAGGFNRAELEQFSLLLSQKYIPGSRQEDIVPAALYRYSLSGNLLLEDHVFCHNCRSALLADPTECESDSPITDTKVLVPVQM